MLSSFIRIRTRNQANIECGKAASEQASKKLVDCAHQSDISMIFFLLFVFFFFCARYIRCVLYYAVSLYINPIHLSIRYSMHVFCDQKELFCASFHFGLLTHSLVRQFIRLLVPTHIQKIVFCWLTTDTRQIEPFARLLTSAALPHFQTFSINTGIAWRCALLSISTQTIL